MEGKRRQKGKLLIVTKKCVESTRKGWELEDKSFSK